MMGSCCIRVTLALAVPQTSDPSRSLMMHARQTSRIAAMKAAIATQWLFKEWFKKNHRQESDSEYAEKLMKEVRSLKDGDKAGLRAGLRAGVALVANTHWMWTVKLEMPSLLDKDGCTFTDRANKGNIEIHSDILERFKSLLERATPEEKRLNETTQHLDPALKVTKIRDQAVKEKRLRLTL